MNSSRQQGAVLIVSLIILIVMTVIGLAGMEITSLEEKMAGNIRDRNIAFQAAESALISGEDYLESQVLLPSFTGSNGLYQRDADLWESINWSDASKVVAVSTAGFGNLAERGAYYIEDVQAAASSDSLELGVPSDNRRFYRVTARAVGQTESAEVILQTVYKR
ncbi:MAG: PilX N-terminal domain-containing pilus assembly protein [Amphritea sp.]|nr:PilX N-terminal domain-containing pilus assembly protein [Amphritea sp.]